MGLHNHSHDQLSSKKLLFSIILNLVITASQYVGGLISGSLSLISDATHNLTDVISLIISYVASVLKQKKQTEHHTFGYKRAEIIAAFINGISLVILSIFLGIESIHRFSKVHPVESNLVIILAIVAIVANTLSVFLLSGDAKKNINMKSAYYHLLTDALVSVAVLIGGLLMKYYEIFWVDSVITLIISVYLLYISWDIILESTKMLMLFAPKHINIKDIELAILKIEGIKNLHHVHLWQLNDQDIYIEAHIEFKENITLLEWDEKCKTIELILAESFGINHSMLQPEFNREDQKKFIIQD
ncbi:MAG: cation diffusion facilitator family transporter [Putridiphycobacter sp.]